MDRRRQLLEVALDLFDERGIRGGSMRELAKRAGVDVAATYHHFPSKQALIRALFEELGVLDAVREPVDHGVLELLRRTDPEDALAFVLEVSLELMEAGAAHFKLIHVEVLYGNEDALDVGREMWDGWARQLEQMVNAAGIATGRGVRPAAGLVRTLVWGAFNDRVEGPLDTRRRRAWARRTARMLAPALPFGAG